MGCRYRCRRSNGWQAFLFEVLESGDVDLVRGSRLEPESGGDSMPLLRYAAGRILALPSSWSARSSIRDPLSGFVALRLSKLPDTLWRGFGYPMHRSAAIAAAGGRIEHVAVPASYPRDGISHHGLHRAPAIFIVDDVGEGASGMKVTVLTTSWPKHESDPGGALLQKLRDSGPWRQLDDSLPRIGRRAG